MRDRGGMHLVTLGCLALAATLLALAALTAVFAPTRQRRDDAYRVLRLLCGGAAGALAVAARSG